MGEKNDCLLKYSSQWVKKMTVFLSTGVNGKKIKNTNCSDIYSTYTFSTYLGPSESNGVNHSLVALSVVELQLI